LGRLPNELGDSNTDLGITSPSTLISDVASSCNIASLTGSLSECSAAANSTMDPSDTDFVDKIRQLWQQSKDHFFYAVSEPFRPNSALAATCAGNCLTVDITDDSIDNGNSFAAVVVLANIPSAGQFRNMYPDIETRDDITNYVIIENSDTASDSALGAYQYFPDTPEFMMCIRDDFPTATVDRCL